MAQRFQLAEARVNASVMRALADRTAHVGAATFPVLYDEPYAVAGVGTDNMAASQPVISALDADLAAVAVGGSIDVEAPPGSGVFVTWTVAEKHPDGAGMTECFLERST